MHLGTQVLNDGTDDGPCSGQTVWAESSVDHSAGVAWDWVEVQDGVVAMADPMGVLTNLQLVDDRGKALSALEAAVQLNGLVHALPWQNEVQRALHPA